MAGAAQGDRATRDARCGPARCRHPLQDGPVGRDPVGGAVFRGRAARDRRARCERDRARDQAFARTPNTGMILTASAFAQFHRKLIITQADRHKLPTVYFQRALVADGGLVSYGPDTIDLHRRAATYVDRILKDEKPADLPVQAPTEYELVINLKTAKALGLTVPITLLGRADAVAAWPLAARAQQPAKLPTVGFIGSDTPDAYAVLLRAFRVGLKATGFIEGQNVAIEYRWAEGRNDKLSEFAVDLVRRQVAVIVAPTSLRCWRQKQQRGQSQSSSL